MIAVSDNLRRRLNATSHVVFAEAVELEQRAAAMADSEALAPRAGEYRTAATYLRRLANDLARAASEAP